MPSSPAKFPPPGARGLEVRPFRALTYRRRDPAYLSRVSSQAYDLVSPSERDRLAAAHPHNVVRLILPRAAPAAGEGHADELRRSVEQAARTLGQWAAGTVLERDAAPALWAYELSPPTGGPATVGWLGAVALPAPGSSAVLPHENTFPLAVEGRRALLAATRTDLEPIVLAHDQDPEIPTVTDAVRQGEPTLQVTDAEGVRHRLWRVTEVEMLARLSAAFSRVNAVIADGHHRFAAARAHHADEPDAAGADALMALLTPMGPGGLRVEAIHRVVPGLDLGAACASAASGFRVRELSQRSDSPDGLVEAVHRWQGDSQQSGFLLSDGRRLVHLDEPAPAVLATVPADAPAAWRGLDVVLAHSGLLQHLWQRADDPAAVLVAHDVREALRSAVERSGVALLLRAPSPADVAAVARAGARMPRKSTLFVPKPRTGLVLRPHAD